MSTKKNLENYSQRALVKKRCHITSRANDWFEPNPLVGFKQFFSVEGCDLIFHCAMHCPCSTYRVFCLFISTEAGTSKRYHFIEFCLTMQRYSCLGNAHTSHIFPNAFQDRNMHVRPSMSTPIPKKTFEAQDKVWRNETVRDGESWTGNNKKKKRAHSHKILCARYILIYYYSNEDTMAKQNGIIRI